MILLEVLLFFVTVSLLGVLGGDTNPGLDQKGTDYLVHFGYAGSKNPNKEMGEITDPDVMTKALKNFQDMAGINQTGVYDAETKKMMGYRRCGVVDVKNMADDTDAKRKKRYTLQGSKWNNKEITYRIRDFTPDLSQNHVETELKRAFQVWSDVTDLTFTRRFSGTPDILILFAEGSHGDSSPFDGRGGTLAHAYFPEFGGDAHFDDAESYSANSTRGVNLFQVAAHEFGHSLGLGHSRVQTALMAPFYRGYQANFNLDRDDIMGIQKIYGSNVRPDPNTRPPTQEPTVRKTDAPMPTPRSMPDKCDISKVDAMLHLRLNDRTYLFSGDYYWRINLEGVDNGYPKLITRYWGIPGSIDAALALEDRSSTIYFFKGNQYWRFSGSRRQAGYPKTLGTDGFYGLQNVKVDAAFEWSGNGRVYIISGDKYYRMDRLTYSRPLPEQARVDPGYPRQLKLWRGLPDRVGAALHYRNGRTYFFKRGSLDYFRFLDRKFKVDSGYPRSTARWWLGCETAGITDPEMEGDSGDDFKNVDNEDVSSQTRIYVTMVTVILPVIASSLLL